MGRRHTFLHCSFCAIVREGRKCISQFGEASFALDLIALRRRMQNHGLDAQRLRQLFDLLGRRSTTRGGARRGALMAASSASIALRND